MVLLENEQFLSRLTLMFDKARTSGHVDVVMKRYDGRTTPIPKKKKNTQPTGKAAKATKAKSKAEASSRDRDEDYHCLIRANLKNEKISSVVHSRDINKFQLAYCTLLKNSIDGLKRQKKVKVQCE